MQASLSTEQLEAELPQLKPAAASHEGTSTLSQEWSNHLNETNPASTGFDGFANIHSNGVQGGDLQPFDPGENSAFLKPNPNLPPYYGSHLPAAFTPVLANPTVEGGQAIPTIFPGQAPDINNETIYKDGTTPANISTQNQNSVVEIWGPSDTKAKTEYLGTGFYVDSHGDIATALHVIKNDKSITVVDNNGNSYNAKVIAERPTSDLAILSIGPEHTTQPVELASNSADLTSGQNLYVIGHPQGWQKQYLSPGTFSKNTISSDASVEGIPNNNPQQLLIQANMNIQPGDSGAPLFNSAGQVVGIADRGDGSTNSDSVSVNDLWPLLTSSMRGDQKNTPNPPGAFPSSIHFGNSTILDTALTAGTGLKYFSHGTSSGFGALTSLGSIIMGAKNFGSDVDFMKTAFKDGTTAEKVDSAIDVGSDVLQLSGGVLGLASPVSKLGQALQFGGSAVRLGNDLAAYRSYNS